MMESGKEKVYYLSSTEILPSPTYQWITLEGASLPRAMMGVRAVSVDNTIMLTGIIDNS